MPAAVLAFLAMLFAAPPAAAGLYKCAADPGVVYQDAACPPGRELRNLDESPATLSVVPGVAVHAAQQPTLRSPARSAAQHRPRLARSRAVPGNATERRFIRTGMSQAEVLLRIGRPDVATKGRGKAGTRWAYLPAPGDPDTLTTVTLAGGTVIDVQRRISR